MSQGRSPLWLVPVSLLLAFILDHVELPAVLAPWRPEFLLLTVLFWGIAIPRSFGLLIGWTTGLVIDVYTGTPLGQHALAYVLCVAVILGLNEWLRSMTPVQQAVLLLPVFLLYEFTMFWIDGITGQSADWLWRWAPALTTTMMWPLIAGLLERAGDPRSED